MRETCARVLAAALMTGAIATAIGLPTLFESDGDLGRGLTTPPSSLQRSVRATAPPAATRPPFAERLAKALSANRPAASQAVVRSTPGRAVTTPRSKPRPAGAGQSPAPPPPAPEPETRELAATTPAPALPAPSAELTHAAPAPDKKAKAGKGKGHGKKAAPAAAAPVVAAPPVEEPPIAPQAEPDEGAEAEERGHGKGHDKEHKHKD